MSGPKKVDFPHVQASARSVRINYDTQGTFTVEISWIRQTRIGSPFLPKPVLPTERREVDVDVIRKAEGLGSLIREGDWFNIIEPGTFKGLDVQVHGRAVIVDWTIPTTSSPGNE